MTNLTIKYADYIASYPQYTLCPKDGKPEYAFIGRSNVGKSSLINMLLKKKDLARVSSKPGKTQMLNYYMINGKWYIVDLPGYGYAKISKTQRHKWEKMINAYLTHREALVCAFVLIDASIPPQKIDLEFINSLGKMNVPFSIVFTKTDKTRKMAQAEANIKAFRTQLLETWDALPQQFITSANKSTGRDDVLNYIYHLNEDYIEFHENL